MTHGAPAPPLTDEQGRALLALARAAVLAIARGRPAPVPGTSDERLQRPQGAFVTLRVEGRLRGCIGMVEAVEPLDRTVLHCAVAAATEDPRFASIAPEDLDRLEVEVSVLGVPRAVDDIAGIVVGEDGLIVSSGRRRGLLLPQVAVEHGWNRDQFLAHACLKAGLDPDAWLHGARIEAFRAQVFAERVGGL